MKDRMEKLKDRMQKHGGQNEETRRTEWRNMKDRIEKYEGQNGETWRIE